MSTASGPTRLALAAALIVPILIISISAQQLAANKSAPHSQQQAADGRSTNSSDLTSSQQQASSAPRAHKHNCTSPSPACTSAEFAIILQKITLNEDNVLASARRADSGAPKGGDSIRPKCVKQLIEMIKSLASGELEMKTLLEFASSVSPLQRRLDLNGLKVSYASERAQDKLDSGASRAARGGRQTGGQVQECADQSEALESVASSSQSVASGSWFGDDQINQLTDDKSRFLTSLVANVDHWLDTLERFTVTSEWQSLMKVFQGGESILRMFVDSKQPKQVRGKSANSTALVVAGAARANATDEFLDELKSELPAQVQTLTTALNQLLPWHVWPWNNIDLFATIDTFLNHGIFAFSKTTSGPERRIDYLSQMLETLFRSLKHDSFPKKCIDWSRVICDREAFHERLALAPAAEGEPAEARQKEVQRLAASQKNVLTQELTCIMFSSLSLQQFGAKDLEQQQQRQPQSPGKQPSSGYDRQQLVAAATSSLLQQNKLQQQAAASSGAKQLYSAPNTKLNWHEQIRKALHLYSLSREALTDEQWLALYQQLHDLWSQMKISDRVIMVGRIVQLITNCHMPREILESALWKDIYKYKNVLNQAGDIVIEELNRSSENGKFTVEQLALGSKHLEKILTKFLDLLPKLIESLSRTIVERLPDLISRFFGEKIAFFKAPCKGYSFAKLIPNLERYQDEIQLLERLVCEQLDIKPSITMMQINNLTYEFLAMAFNFSSFGGSLQSLPGRFRGGVAGTLPIALPTTAAPSSSEAPTGAERRLSAAQEPATSTAAPAEATSAASPQQPAKTTAAKPVATTSIIDELAANPRLAQIVAILQSSPLDPPEVHAELPELDWVEAGTSVALFYETIQKLLSHEGPFVVFPELGQFQDEIQTSVASSRQLFKRFSKQDPINLAAYGFDTLMPILLRTFQPLESFHQECLSTFYDIFGRFDSPPDSMHVRESRQWQCAISSTNFAFYSMNNLIKTFNSMLRNIQRQMSRQQESGGNNLLKSAVAGASAVGAARTKAQPIASQPEELSNSTTPNATCVLFDGSVTTLMDNLPLLIDLTLETVLITSTNSPNQQSQMTLRDTLCQTNHTLDPFSERQTAQRRSKLKEAVCHLLHESSLATCSEALRIDEWTRTMKELNATWFEASAVSVEPSFRSIIQRAHEFLDLFGKVKPSSMSDGLIARVLNLNSYWTSLVNKIVSSVEKYREKRFELALQVLIPIVYDNFDHDVQASGQNATESASRITFKTFILLAKSTIDYVENTGSSSNSSSERTSVEGDLRFLFDWADKYSPLVAEVVLRTLASNISRLEELIVEPHANGTELFTFENLWTKFCSKPVDSFLEIEKLPVDNKASLTNQVKLADLTEAKETLCKFNWKQMQTKLLASESDYSSGNNSSSLLDSYNDEQLIRILLTKWGQLLDVLFASGLPPAPRAGAQRLPKFLSISHWQPLQEKISQLAPAQFGPSDFTWIWQGFEQLINRYDTTRQQLNNATLAHQTQNQTLDNLLRVFEQLNCALDSVKGGLTWDNLVNIYQDRQDILAAHSTINNGIALASAGANTFLAHKKFQKFLDDFVKPRVGLNAFCDMRDKSKLEKIFSASAMQQIRGDKDIDLAGALESFQELICDTNIDNLAQNLNPISSCYQMSAPTAASTNTTRPAQASGPLANIMDRFFKLASLAVLDAKLVDTDNAKPQIFDKSQWDNLRDWWLNQTEAHQGNSGLALTLVRIFQTTDSINADHVVWKALFRSVHELSEVAVYLIRAAEMESQQAQQVDATNSTAISLASPSRLTLVRETAQQVDQLLKSNRTATAKRSLVQQQQLASTLTNVLFPEANNFISFKTFKQLRYVKSISDYFVSTPGAQAAICSNISLSPAATSRAYQRFELIGYKLDSSEKLTSLLCHYEASQWLTTLNIVLSSKTSSLSKKVNYMTKYLSIFVKRYRDTEHLQSFIHGQQLENIEAVANTTVSYLIALSHPFKTLSLSKISNISWHSLPGLFDSINSHLCASKYENQQQQQQSRAPTTPAHGYQLAQYEPKKPELETIICKLPTWNITQIYNYFSENFDLQNMISLVMQNNRTASILGISATASTTSPATTTATGQAKPCITPFKFASKWLKIVQDLIDEVMSKSSRDKLKKCFGSSKKNQSISKEALRYVKLFNNLLSTINDLTVNNSWSVVRKAWNSVSYALLNQSLAPSTSSAVAAATTAPLIAAPSALSPALA